MCHADDSDIDEGETELDLDTHGFSFTTLKLVSLMCWLCYYCTCVCVCVCRSLHADLASQLEDFKLHIEHSSREIPELKAWQLQGTALTRCCQFEHESVMYYIHADLGLQAAQRVATSPPDMALSVIRDLTQSLPTSAR